MTAPLDFDALEKLAGGMTPGKRKIRQTDSDEWALLPDPGREWSIAFGFEEHEAEAAAAFDRETLLVLIALARRTEQAERTAERNHTAASLVIDGLTRERDEARLGAQVDIGERDAAIDACQRRIAAVMRERDEARAALAEARPPLDPAHVEALRDMKHSSEALLADADDGTETYRRLLGQRIAALEAVIQEEMTR